MTFVMTDRPKMETSCHYKIFIAANLSLSATVKEIEAQAVAVKGVEVSSRPARR